MSSGWSCYCAPFSNCVSTSSLRTIVHCETHRLSTFSLRLSNSFSRNRQRCSQPPPVRTHWSPGERQSWPKNGIFVSVVSTPKCDDQNPTGISNNAVTTSKQPSAVRVRTTCAAFTYYVMPRQIPSADWSAQLGYQFDLYWQATIGCVVTWPVLINTVKTLDTVMRSGWRVPEYCASKKSGYSLQGLGEKTGVCEICSIVYSHRWQYKTLSRNHDYLLSYWKCSSIAV